MTAWEKANLAAIDQLIKQANSDEDVMNRMSLNSLKEKFETTATTNLRNLIQENSDYWLDRAQEANNTLINDISTKRVSNNDIPLRRKDIYNYLMRAGDLQKMLDNL